MKVSCLFGVLLATNCSFSAGYDDSASNLHKSIENVKSGNKIAGNGSSKLGDEYLGSEASRKDSGDASGNSEKTRAMNTGNSDLYSSTLSTAKIQSKSMSSDESVIRNQENLTNKDNSINRFDDDSGNDSDIYMDNENFDDDGFNEDSNENGFYQAESNYRKAINISGDTKGSDRYETNKRKGFSSSLAPKSENLKPNNFSLVGNGSGNIENREPRSKTNNKSWNVRKRSYTSSSDLNPGPSYISRYNDNSGMVGDNNFPGSSGPTTPNYTPGFYFGPDNGNNYPGFGVNPGFGVIPGFGVNPGLGGNNFPGFGNDNGFPQLNGGIIPFGFNDGGYPGPGFGNGLPLQPWSSLPGQPSGGLPLQPWSSLPGQPSGGLPLQPWSSLPGQPSGGLPLQPWSSLPGQPSGGLPLQHWGGLPGQPSGGLPLLPSGGLPAQPWGGLPVQPSGGLPGQPWSGLPVQPWGGFPVQPWGGNINPSDWNTPGSNGGSDGSTGYSDDGGNPNTINGWTPSGMQAAPGATPAPGGFPIPGTSPSQFPGIGQFPQPGVPILIDISPAQVPGMWPYPQTGAPSFPGQGVNPVGGPGGPNGRPTDNNGTGPGGNVGGSVGGGGDGDGGMGKYSYSFAPFSEVDKDNVLNTNKLINSERETNRQNGGGKLGEAILNQPISKDEGMRQVSDDKYLIDNEFSRVKSTNSVLNSDSSVIESSNIRPKLSDSKFSNSGAGSDGNDMSRSRSGSGSGRRLKKRSTSGSSSKPYGGYTSNEVSNLGSNSGGYTAAVTPNTGSVYNYGTTLNAGAGYSLGASAITGTGNYQYTPSYSSSYGGYAANGGTSGTGYSGSYAAPGTSSSYPAAPQANTYSEVPQASGYSEVPQTSGYSGGTSMSPAVINLQTYFMQQRSQQAQSAELVAMMTRLGASYFAAQKYTYLPAAGGACNAGQYACDPKVAMNFLQCDNGKYVAKPCSVGTVCVFKEETPSYVCGRP
ncbi:hypothetical protein AYI70_g1627 [Smittium culicis]|uniref:Carbohydrate-binding module family 19 domain-containing protein n=1 Tax=Smittium culicis TaxID=133412 RepID=A0A1R1YBW8_9FUNG|nr:hypothetical protein AYI70_g1627 [Smittium culicis]